MNRRAASPAGAGGDALTVSRRWCTARRCTLRHDLTWGSRLRSRATRPGARGRGAGARGRGACALDRPGLIAVLGPATQLDVLHGCRTAGGVRHDVVELQEGHLGAALAGLANESTTASVPVPDGTAHGGGDVTRTAGGIRGGRHVSGVPGREGRRLPRTRAGARCLAGCGRHSSPRKSGDRPGALCTPEFPPGQLPEEGGEGAVHDGGHVAVGDLVAH